MEPANEQDAMAHALAGVRSLATRVQRDRQPICALHLFRERVVEGDGLLSGNENKEEPEEPERPDQQSLFVGEGESDSDYDDEVMDGDEMDWETADNPTEADLAWASNLSAHNDSLHAPMKPGQPTPCPHLVIEPRRHQYVALGKIERAMKSASKALLIADPPGLGKTLISMMAIVKSIAAAGRFSFVVVPSSCIEQWFKEFHKFFTEGTVRVLVVRDASVSPTTMLNYDVIILSYSFVMSRYRKWVKYLQLIKAMRSKEIKGRIPERPNLSIFSEMFDSDDGVKSPFLVLDEANAFKNPRTATFASIFTLRQRCDTCLMLTGSPIDNQWHDIYALLQMVKGHEINTKTRMMNLLGTRDMKRPGRWTPPKGLKFVWLLQILNSFMVRRPETTISLPPLEEKTIGFELSDIEVGISNDTFETYQTAMRIASTEKKSRSKKQSPPFKSLTHALQHACHPRLVELMDFIRYSDEEKKRERRGEPTGEDADILYDAEHIAKWSEWRESLKANNNWESSRITAIIDAFNECRDRDPDCSVIIMDESVYFLDVVQIAFEAMYDPIECLRYDGREFAERRPAIQAEFDKSGGHKVMLMSRGVGGLGLNIPSANVIIQCCPWWKREWEVQAMGRAYREGQKRAVTYIKLTATNSHAEIYKTKTRDRKHTYNSRVVKALTRADGGVTGMSRG
ncbi:hypothetical protein HBH53_059490 [Parastagonospora nodorum]|nr:hypothetical protein HBH53_059490 [Parastagonospora nodorum]